MPRFVVLEHLVGASLRRTRDPVHWDWMFESGQTLRTWATDPITDLLDRSEQTIRVPESEWSVNRSATPLDNHRLAYLEFEGEIGNDRGRVRQLLNGDYTATEQAADRFAARLHVSGSHQTISILIQRRRGENLEAEPIDEATVERPWSLRWDSTGSNSSRDSFGE